MAIITYSYWLLLSIVSGIGIVRYKKLTKPFKILTFSVIVALLLTVMSRIVSAKYKTNAPIIHLETITGYIFYSLSYYYLFKNKKIKIILLVSIGIMILFFFIDAILLQPFLTIFPTYVFLTTQTLYIVFSLLMYKQMLLYPMKVNIIKQSVFWYNTAILFYSTTLFVNLGLANFVVARQIADIIIFYFWYFVLYLFYILIGVSFLTDNEEINSTNA